MNHVFFFLFLLTVLFIPASTSAHVVVTPREVGVGVFQTFTVAVPVEKDIPTTELRLVIPQGLQHITPNVKPGWTIDIKKEGERVSEIIWSGGLVPVGQREEFVFSAQSPTNPTRLAWKAYQTYSDGTVVSWDQSPETKNDDHESTPYSETLVFNDLGEEKEAGQAAVNQPNSLPLVFSVVAIIFSAAAFGLQIQGKKNK